MSLRKLSVLVVSLAAVLGLAWPAFASAADPPPVQSGSAKSNCERIVAAGFSPHDYVHRVVRTEQYSIKVVDYFHVFYNHLSNEVNGIPLSLALSLQSEQTGSNAQQDSDLVEGHVVTEKETDNSTHQNLGALTDADGQAIPASIDDYDAGDTGNLDAYTWTPNGGSPVVYRDRTGTATYSESEWVYDPEWAGPDAARMSSIWGATPACVS